MIELLRHSPRYFRIQNTLSVLVFAVIAAAHISALLVYAGVRTSWSWYASIHLNRLASPVLDPLYHWVANGAAVTLAILLALCLVPLCAQWRRSWLGTSAAGHVALGICIALLIGVVERALPGARSASLAEMPIRLETATSGTTLIAIIVPLLVLCLLNHLQFFVGQIRPKNLKR